MKVKKKNTIRTLVISGIITIGIILGVIAIQKTMLSSYKEVTVVVAKKEIPEHTFISAKNKDEYFEEIQIQRALVMDQAVRSMKDIEENFIKYPMQKKEQLTYKKALSVGKDIMEKYDEAVEVSLKVDNLSDAVSGTLRKGDIVDIVAKSDGTDGQLTTILQNVYISGTYYSDGSEVEDTSEKKASVVFNFLIEKKDYMDFFEGTADGGVKLVKVS